MKKVWLILLVCFGLLLTGCDGSSCSPIQRLYVIGWSSDHERIFLHYQSSTGLSEKDFIYEYNLINRSLKKLVDFSEDFPEKFVHHEFVVLGYNQSENEVFFAMGNRGIQTTQWFDFTLNLINLNTPKKIVEETKLTENPPLSMRYYSKTSLTPDQKYLVFAKAGEYFNRETKKVKQLSLLSETYSFETIFGGYGFFDDETLMLLHRPSDSDQLITAEFDAEEGTLKNFNTIAVIKDSSTHIGFLGKQDAETLLYYRQTDDGKTVWIGSYNMPSKEKSEKKVAFEIRPIPSVSGYSSKHQKIAFAMDDFLYLSDINTGKVEQLLDAYWTFPKQENVVCKLSVF